MNHVFLSYSRIDSAFIHDLVDVLTARGIAFWLDQRSLPVSLPWLEEIRDAIEESVLVVICDSSNHRSSAACSAERTAADDLIKALTFVNVAKPASVAADAIERELALVSRALIDRTELRIRARDWKRAGRPGRQLARFSDRHRLKRAAAKVQDLDPVSSAYLAASGRRSIRRLVIGVTAATAVTFLAFLGIAVVNHQTTIAKSTATLAEMQSEVAGIAEVAATDPYTALQAVAELGSTESFLHAQALAVALNSPVPDDAFAVPDSPLEFTTPLIGEIVAVANEQGDHWHREARARDVRDAQPGDSPSTGPQVPSGALVASVDNLSGIIQVTSSGRIHRRLVAPGVVTEAIVSPDGRRVAASIGDTVVLIDIETGTVKAWLRGAPARIDDLAWDEVGERLWAATGPMVVSWQVADARVVVDDPGAWYIRIMPQGDGTMWLFDRAGTLQLVEVATGELLEMIDIGSEVFASATDLQSQSVFLNGEATAFLVDLESRKVSPRPAIECNTSSMTIASSGRLLVACRRGPLQIIDLDSGTLLSEIKIPDGARSVALRASDGPAYVGTEDGRVLLVDLTSATVKDLHQLRCRGAIAVLSVSEGQVLPVGAGTGRYGCSSVLQRDGDWAQYGHYVGGNVNTRAATFVLKGEAFAVGHPDGTIVIHPTENLLPVTSVVWVAGPPRDMVFIESTSELVVATRNGLVVAIPIQAIPSNASFAEEAERRLQRAVELDLVV